MRVLQARSRAAGPDTYTLSVLPSNDPTFHFNVRRATLDGSLVSLVDDDGEALLVLRDTRDGLEKEVKGRMVAHGIWQFELRSSDVSLAHDWRVDAIQDGRRTTHALGTFTYPRR